MDEVLRLLKQPSRGKSRSICPEGAMLSTGGKMERLIGQRNKLTRVAAHNVGKDRNDEGGRVSEDDDVVHVMMRDTLRSKGGAMES